MKSPLLVTAAVALASSANAEIFFKEQFNDEKWSERWTVPTKWKSKGELGEWVHTTGKWHGPDESDKAIQTSGDMRFFGLSAPLSKPIRNLDHDLVVQYTVKHEVTQECGGAYLKLLPGDKKSEKFDAASFGGDTPYGIMFGPDICGFNKRTHAILHSHTKNENLLINKDIHTESDNLSHMYTLVIRKDNTFEVFVDQKSVRAGKLEDEFDFLAPKEIEDPSVTKPANWVDAEYMDDPDDKKPDGYDDIPREIPDPQAKKPQDWDDEEDGEWEAPTVDNPDYKGPWFPKRIKNTDYKGPWVHPKIPNPDYSPDESIHAVCQDCTHIGFELWQVKSGTIFDDIIITDSLEEAQKFAEETFFAKKDNEKEMYNELNKKGSDDSDDEEFPTFDDIDMEDVHDEL